MSEVINIHAARRNRASNPKPPAVAPTDVLTTVRNEADLMVRKWRARRLGIRLVPPPSAAENACSGCGCALDTRETIAVVRRGSTFTAYCRPCGNARDAESEVFLEIGRAEMWMGCDHCKARISPTELCARDHVARKVSCLHCWEKRP